MRILLISMYYYPEPHSIPHDLAVELRKRGHSVSVITGFPNYPTGKIYDKYRMRPWQRETIDGIAVLRLPFYINRGKSAVGRVLSYISFTFAATAGGLFLIKRPNVIWTYQVGLPGVTLGTLKRASLIHEVQDLWPEWAQSHDMGMKTWLYKLLDLQERFIYRFASAIVTISTGFQHALKEKNVPACKIHIIPNWANEELFRPLPRDPALGEREQFNETFNIMYIGNIGTAQGLDVVIQTAGQLRDLADLRFVIIGDGVDRDRLSHAAATQGLSNVRFLGSRPQNQAAQYLAWADAALIHLKDAPMYLVTIPSKTYAYLACGRPVLAAANGDVAELITDLMAGIVCPSDNPTAMAQSVRILYHMPAEKREELGRNGRRAFEQQFTRQILAERYDTLFRAAIGEAPCVSVESV